MIQFFCHFITRTAFHWFSRIFPPFSLWFHEISLTIRVPTRLLFMSQYLLRYWYFPGNYLMLLLFFLVLVIKLKTLEILGKCLPSSDILSIANSVVFFTSEGSLVFLLVVHLWQWELLLLGTSYSLLCSKPTYTVTLVYYSNIANDPYQWIQASYKRLCKPVTLWITEYISLCSGGHKYKTKMVVCSVQ